MEGLECDSLGGWHSEEQARCFKRRGKSQQDCDDSKPPHILFVWNILSPTSMCPFEVLLQCSSINEASSVHPVSHSHDTPALNVSRVMGATRKGFRSFHSLINLGRCPTEQTFQYHILIGQNK